MVSGARVRSLGSAGRRGGFTLIELIVVMTVLALLLSLAAPRYFGSVDRSKEAVLRQNLNVMRDAIDKFHTDTGAYPTAIEQLVAKRYLRAVPVDPFTDSSESWKTIPPPDGPAGGVYDVRSGATGTAPGGTAFSDL